MKNINEVVVHLTYPGATGIVSYSGQCRGIKNGWVYLESNNLTADRVRVMINKDHISFIEVLNNDQLS